MTAVAGTEQPFLLAFLNLMWVGEPDRRAQREVE